MPGTTGDDNQVFSFARQTVKLDGSTAPLQRVTTFTNYDTPNDKGDVLIITLYRHYTTGFYSISANGTTLSITADLTQIPTS